MESMWNHALVRCLISHCCVCPASSLKVQRPDLNDKLKRAEARRKEEEERRREELQRREEEQQRKELRRKEEEERKRAELEAKQKLKEDRSKAAKQAVAAAATKPEATKPAVAAVAAAVTKPADVSRQTAAVAVASAAGGRKEEGGPAVGAPLQGRSANIMPPAAAAAAASLLLPGGVVKKAAAAATVPPPAALPGFSAVGLAAAAASSAGNQNNAPTPSFRAPPMAAQYPPMTPAEMVRALTDNPPNSDKSPQIHRVTFSFVLIFTFWNALCPSGSGREEHQAVGHLALRQPRRPAPHTGGLQGHQPGPQL